MTNQDTQLPSLDDAALATVHGGLPLGKIWQAVVDTAKKVTPFLVPAWSAGNITKRATDDK